MAKQGKLFSARDAVSNRAFLELMSSIEAIPIRTLKPSKDKGGLYLVHFHESTSACFLTRLPSNLIRALVSYNTITELWALSLTCRQFSKFLFDKYIQFSGELENLGLYRAPTFKFQDYFDFHRLEELKNLGKRVKIYGSIRPEFASIFHVSARGDLFYSYHEGTILEGTFLPNADTLAIKCARPCIPNVILTDVSGEAIACVNATELALSLPTFLRQVTMASSERPVAVYFLANKRMILVLKEHCFELYHTTLALAQVLPHEGWITKLYLPDPAKAVFATFSDTAITSYAVVVGGTLRVKFKHERKFGDPFIIDILIHRETVQEEHYDFLILLQSDRALLVNFKPVTSETGWQQIYMCEGHLIALKPDSLQVFSFSPDSKTYISTHTLRADLLGIPSFPVLLSCSRMKIASVYTQVAGLSISYYQPFANSLKFFYELQLPVEGAKVTFHRQIILIKGEVLKWKPAKQPEPPQEEGAKLVETVPCVYIINFNADSMIGGAPDLVSQAIAAIEERDREKFLLEQKRLERKQQKRAEKARKHEELDSKHKPRH